MNTPKAILTYATFAIVALSVQVALAVPLNADSSNVGLVRRTLPVSDREGTPLQSRDVEEKLQDVQSGIDTASSALEFGQKAHEVVKEFKHSGHKQSGHKQSGHKHRTRDIFEGTAGLGPRGFKEKVEEGAQNVQSTVETAGQAIDIGKDAHEAFKVLKHIHRIRRDLEALD